MRKNEAEKKKWKKKGLKPPHLRNGNYHNSRTQRGGFALGRALAILERPRLRSVSRTLAGESREHFFFTRLRREARKKKPRNDLPPRGPFETNGAIHLGIFNRATVVDGFAETNPRRSSLSLAMLCASGSREKRPYLAVYSRTPLGNVAARRNRPDPPRARLQSVRASYLSIRLFVCVMLNIKKTLLHST